MKKLPIGIQTFEKIINEDYIYIDKTDIALDIISNYNYVFLSRPRRFGKSLFLDTLKNIFEGNKELFSGLYIYDKWDFQTKYPVIKISFGGVRSKNELERVIFSILRDNQNKLEVNCLESSDYAICFKDLIVESFKKYNQKVVILIDEYDKPILDNLDQIEVAKENREILKRLYTEIKNQDEYIKFVFLTGVSKFSKASIFSGLNMLSDITLNSKFGNICGYSQRDLETSFKEYLQNQDMQKIKEWYNGYNFLKDSMYNPFDILQFIQNDFMYKNYWFETGTPTFLIKLIEKNNYFLPRLSNLKVGEELLGSFDIENLDLEVVLFQAGYLTIDRVEMDEDEDIIYTLKLPNREIKSSLNTFIIQYLYKDTTLQRKNLSQALRDENLNSFKTALISIFASIPYSNFTNTNMQNYEGFYASIIYVYLQSLGLDIIGEDVTNKGRIDLTIKIKNSIYILEFKVDGKDALKQIKERNYHQKYLDENKNIYLIGIEFDKNEKNISNFKWEKI